MTSMRLTSTCCQEEKEAGCQEDAIVHGAEGMGRAAYRCHGSVSRSTAKKFELASKTAGDTLPRFGPLTRCMGRICWLGSAHVRASGYE